MSRNIKVDFPLYFLVFFSSKRSRKKCQFCNSSARTDLNDLRGLMVKLEGILQNVKIKIEGG